MLVANVFDPQARKHSFALAAAVRDRLAAR